MNQKIKERNSNFELLRFIAEVNVVFVHVGFKFKINQSRLNKNKNLFNYYCCFRYFSGHLSNMLFSMISGFFLVKSKFKAEQILRIEMARFFYDIIFLFIGHFKYAINFQNISHFCGTVYHFYVQIIGMFLVIKQYFLSVP